MTIAVLTALAFVLSIAAFVAVLLATGRQSRGPRGPSPWRYGAGATHTPDSLPPITDCTTSVPTGSSLPSHFPNSKAVRNRPERHSH
ncbi:MAG: hypothetical protein WCC36_16300 [Gammaproteobacteria bacterium]